MTLNPTAPGVYVSEVPSGSRAIVGVATSITAFVGRALRGPVDTPVKIGSMAEFVRIFGPVWRESGLGFGVRDFYVNGGGAALVVRVVAADSAVAHFDVDDLKLVATGPGEWANTMKIGVSHPGDEDATEIAAAQGLAETDKDRIYTLAIAVGDDSEVHVNVTGIDGPRRVDRVLSSSRLVRVDGVPAQTRPDATPRDGEHTVSAQRGADGGNPSADDYAEEGSTKGVLSLVHADLVNIIVIPPIRPGMDVYPEVWGRVAGFAQSERAFLIIDPPQLMTVPSAVRGWVMGPAGVNGPAGRNAAIYFPQIKAPDPLSGGAIVERAASGAIAGLYARTDASRGIWKAPAGTDAALVGAVAPSVLLTQGDNEVLNPDGVNAIRTFRDTGTVVWGARTTRGADALADDYKYVPVRRLALYIEESLFRGTQWVVFEPNDEPLWSQIRLSVGSFMHDLFRRGALQGVSPKQAYFVNCGADTTTQYDIDRGIVNIEVGFAPLKPAEFVMISIQQITAAQE